MLPAHMYAALSAEANFDWCMNINLHGLIHMTRAFLPGTVLSTKVSS